MNGMSSWLATSLLLTFTVDLICIAVIYNVVRSFSAFSAIKRFYTVTVACLLLLGWHGTAAYLAYRGFFISHEDSISPIGPLALLFLLCGYWLALKTETGRSIITHTSLNWIVGLQIFRLLGSVFLLLLWQERLPAEFALFAGLGDTLIGLSAPLIVFALWRGYSWRYRAAIYWSIVGILDLIVAFVLGFLSSPSPLQLLALDNSNVLISEFPLVLIPVFHVPFALLLHVLALWKIMNREHLFSDKQVLITGASSGIGAELAKRFSQRGATVILLARRKEKLNQLASEITTRNGLAHNFAVDLADSNAVRNTLQTIDSTLGIPDIIVNCAGDGCWQFLYESSHEKTVSMMAVPYFSAAQITQYFLPKMLARRHGHIVNITSIVSRVPFPGCTGYTAARWAMRGLHEALRSDLRGTGLHTTLVTFAKVSSSFWQNNPGSEKRVPKAQILIPVLSSERAADRVIRGVSLRQVNVIAPFMVRIVILLRYLTPWLTQWIVDKSGYRNKAELVATSTWRHDNG